MATTQPKNPEDTFREALKDAAAVIKALAVHCQSPEEMISMIKLAVENPGQLRLLISEVQRLQ